MAKTYNRLELDVNKKFSGMITEVQGDSNSRYLDVSLFNNGVPLDLTGHEVKIFMEKPENGGEIWNDGVITDATAGRCEFLMTTEALSKVGHLQAQISVWKDNTEILSTQVFEIYVTKTLLGNSSVESSNEYGTLVVLFQNLYEAHELMTTMVQNIGLPAEVAAQYNLATMWQAWEFLVAYMKGDFTDKVDEAIANSSVQGVLDKIGSAGDSGDSTLFGRLSNASIIKSIQRGRIPDGSSCISNNNTEKPEYKFQSNSSTYTEYVDIPISTVDISRCIVKAYRFSTYECFTEFVDANTLRIFAYTSNSIIHTLQGAIEWQIIEFK